MFRFGARRAERLGGGGSGFAILRAFVFLHGGYRRGVGQVIEFVVRMPLDLDPRYAMPGAFRKQRLPQVPIFHGFFARRFPSVALPASEPVLVEGIRQIGAVRVEPHGAGRSKMPQRFERRRQFHTVVGGVRRPAA